MAAVSVCLSVGGYLREVCCVVVKLLLKHQPLVFIVSLCGAFAGTTAGETSQCLPVARERLSYLFWMIQPHTMKDPPSPGGYPRCRGQRGCRSSGKKRGKGGRRVGPDIVSYKLHSSCEL